MSKKVVISKDGIPYTNASLKERLKTSQNTEFLKRALLHVYRLQTSDEQNVGHTTYLNGVGFNAVDSRLLSNLAKKVQSGKQLFSYEFDILRARLPKYSSQLLSIIALQSYKDSK